jgi:hypothetical protein
MIVDADGDTVCDPSPMGEADARLMAAAPALLEALQALVGEADLGELDHDDETRELIERARDAIERATGVPV